MTNVIPLIEQYKGLHPTTGKPVVVVGVDASSYVPRLVVIINDANGIRAECVEYVDALKSA